MPLSFANEQDMVIKNDYLPSERVRGAVEYTNLFG